MFWVNKGRGGKVQSPSVSLSSGYSAIAIALGQSHTCAIVSGGTLKCWGYNSNGQLGISSYNTQYSPVDVLGSGMARAKHQS